jgi:hypothetical protein
MLQGRLEVVCKAPIIYQGFSAQATILFHPSFLHLYHFFTQCLFIPTLLKSNINENNL